MASRAPIVFDIEGNIGAGKTTYAKALDEELRKRFPDLKILTVLEPVEEWKESGALARFYEDPRGANAYAFQTYVFATRIIAIQRAWERMGRADVVILDRSPWADYHIFFMNLVRSGAVDAIFARMYDDWYWMWTLMMPFLITHRLAIVCDVFECHDRLTKRDRGGETISVDYLNQLQETHASAYEREAGNGIRQIQFYGSVAETAMTTEWVVAEIKKWHAL